MPPSTYKPKRPMLAHQARGFELSKDKPNFFLSMEQRTGKSKLTLDTVAYQYDQGAIDALIVVAWPAGVHRKWVTDDLPDDLPDRCNPLAVIWRASLAGRKYFQTQLDALLTHPGLAVISINAEALTTEALLVFLRKFVKARKGIFLVADESTWLKTHDSERTKKAWALGKQPTILFRRTLDGTPGEGPLDLYSQYTFLDPRILGVTGKGGKPSFTVFKARYAEYEDSYDPRSGRTFKKLKKYRNIADLNRRIAPYTFRVRRDECADLPPKVYQKRYFQLSPKQRAAYDELRETYMLDLGDDVMRTASNVLVRYLRLQQVASNYWPGSVIAELCPVCMGEDEGCLKCRGAGVLVTKEPAIIIDEKRNPRLDALEQELTGNTEPAVIWARFQDDIDQVMALCGRMGRIPMRYDGSCSPDAKAAAIAAFQGGTSDTIVGNPRAGGRGIKLTAARTIIYYSNDFSLLTRLQSEDRAESLDRKVSTGIVDIIAEDTVDEPIVDALRGKKKLMDQITGDPKRKWL